MTRQWWRDAVVYQIYPRSFADADGDGVGDLDGITAHLPHVADLGVDAVWLTPFQRSPQADHGYDVSDYVDVDPLFGDLAAFDRLLARAHALGLRIVVDLVPNHASSAHPLFAAALTGAPGGPERARFHFAAGRGPGAAAPPNNWPSVFGGPAWTRVVERDGRPGEWYLHLYAPEQPDWNWRDPRTPEFFDAVLRFWFDRGVDGMRIDVAHGLVKAAGLPDLTPAELAAVRPGRLRAIRPACDQEEVHEIYRRWRELADSYDVPAGPSRASAQERSAERRVPEPSARPRVLVGEVNLEPARGARYTRPGELHQAFAFGFLDAPWDAQTWMRVGAELLDAREPGGGPVTWVSENHDVVRTPTRYAAVADASRGAARARAAVLAVLGLPGGTYLYQGQELGLPEVDVPDEARRDPAWARSGRSRDGCRVPIPWRREPAGAFGFSPAGAAPPWLPVPDRWGTYAVEAAEADPTSTLHLCRAALALRRRLHDEGVLTADDPVAWEAGDGGRLVARRGGFVLVVAMGEEPVALPPGEVLLASAPVEAGRLPRDAAAWLRTPPAPLIRPRARPAAGSPPARPDATPPA
jgi:alpha-glucosidase